MRLDPEISARTLDTHAMPPDDFVITAEQEVYILPRPGGLGAVETTHRSAADYCNFHVERATPAMGPRRLERKRHPESSECPVKKVKLLCAQNRIFACLGDAKLNDTLGGNLDLFTGGGIPAEASSAIHQDEFAESG